MGLFDALLGRTKPVEANLDNLFALPGAAITIELGSSLVSSGHAGVCWKGGPSSQNSDAEREMNDLLATNDDGTESAAGPLRASQDSFGYKWLVVDDDDVASLVTRAHLVNSTLEDRGFGPQLLCSVFGLVPTKDAGDSVKPGFLVYLYKRGTFYPFFPLPGQRRDNEAELRLSGIIGADLPIEKDLTRWMPLWEMPVT